ncbi:MAG: hypothetical protein FWC83_00695 [Alphaproteobacteria bacterium]|nr:hypothetical protein [Alphaproteobacteria bacterium]
MREKITDYGLRITVHDARGAAGNFMLQALLALSLVIAFMPMMVRQITTRTMDTEMAAAVNQINSMIPAMRAFGMDNHENFILGTQVFEEQSLINALEPYGLPIGFRPQTPFGQRISVMTTRDEEDTDMFIIMSGGNMRTIDRAEMALRIGFWGAQSDGDVLRGSTGGWDMDMSAFRFRPYYRNVYVRVPLFSEVSDLLSVRSRRTDDNQMHTDINMGGHDVRGVRDASATDGRFVSVLAADLILSGTEDGRRFRNRIDNFNITRANFSAPAGTAALNISRGNLATDTFTGPSISNWGDPGNLAADLISVNSLSLAAGRTGFTGPHNWHIRQDAIMNNIAITADSIEVMGIINATRGQDVFIDDGEITAGQRSGIEVNDISAAAITLRDQTSSALLAGITGRLLVDIRLAGMSVFPDVLLDDINNNDLRVLARPLEDSDMTITCRTIIESLPGIRVAFDARSLAQNMVCRYVFFNRLEQRLDYLLSE